MWGAILGLAGSLIGAKKDSDARKRSDYMNSPQGIRSNAEEAGFNPLVFAGPGTGTGAQYAPTMGSIISNGFAAAADSFNQEKQLRLQRSQLEMENERLNKVVQETTLTPKISGIYGNGTGLRGSSGAYAGVSRRRDSDGSRLDHIDPTRDVDIAPVLDAPGLAQIRNKYIPRGIVVPGADGEPMGFDELLVAATFGAPQLVKQAYSAYRYNREMAPHEAAWKKWSKASTPKTEKSKKRGTPNPVRRSNRRNY